MKGRCEVEASLTGVLLKELRNSRGWSLDSASAACGVSKAMLGQIERHESSPTVATLWKIVTGFDVPMTALLERREPGALLGESKAAPRVKLSAPVREQSKPLFSYDPETGLEVFVIELESGQSSMSSAHREGVREHLIVVQGELEVFVSGLWQRIEAGSGLRFDADQPHGYRNMGDGVCVFHDIIHYQYSTALD